MSHNANVAHRVNSHPSRHLALQEPQGLHVPTDRSEPGHWGIPGAVQGFIQPTHVLATFGFLIRELDVEGPGGYPMQERTLDV